MNNVFAEFLTNKGLYDTVEITRENISHLIDLLNGDVKLSCYCTKCKTERVFYLQPIKYFIDDNEEYIPILLSDDIKNHIKLSANDEQWTWIPNISREESRIFVLKFVCAMDKSHHLDYVLTTDNNTMKKIGQFPTIADLTFPILNVYDKVIHKDIRKEFGIAIGLYANGVGAGSYVYLRRIFEKILYITKEKVKDKIDTSKFDDLHINQKISVLKEFLPNILIENKNVHGILSKGIHGLSEEQCIEYFPIVRDCIFMILDEWEKSRRENENKRLIEKNINKTINKINET